MSPPGGTPTAMGAVKPGTGPAGCVARFPTSYAYIILAFCSLGKVLSAPGQSPVIGTIVDDLSDDLHLSRSHISSLYLAATICSSLTLPGLGLLVDKAGPRVMGFAVCACLGVACLIASSARSSFVLWFGFYLLRLFGQGGQVLVGQTVINLWWIKRRGLAMGVGGAIMSLGTVGSAPIIVRHLSEKYGWRWTYRCLAVVCAVVAPMLGTFYRRKPETYGLLPDNGGFAMQPDSPDGDEAGTASDSKPDHDGDEHDGAKLLSSSSSPSASSLPLTAAAAGGGDGSIDTSAITDGADDEEIVVDLTRVSPADSDTDTGVPASPLEVNFTPKQAVRTTAFWAYVSASFCIAATATAVYFHATSVFEEANVSSGLVDTVFVLSAVVSAASNIGGGALVDRVPTRYAMSVALALQAVCMTCLALASPFFVILMALSLGVSMGLASNVGGIVYANLFGRKHLGAISGIAKPFLVCGSAVGPLPIALGHDMTGNYRSSFLLGAIVPVVFSVLVLKFGKAPPPPSHSHRHDPVPKRKPADLQAEEEGVELTGAAANTGVASSE